MHDSPTSSTAQPTFSATRTYPDFNARVAERFSNEQPIAVGRIVHFVALDSKTIRPALVVRAWSPTCLQLQVFYDGSNDNEARGKPHGYDPSAPLTEWATSICYDGGEERFAEVVDGATGAARRERVYNPRTWHWPPRT